MSEQKTENAINWIRDNAAHYAKAKSERVYLEQYRKSKKAILIQNAPASYKTTQARESYAYSHADYLLILEALKIAVEEEEKLRYLIRSAELKFEQWRTMQANHRAEFNRYGNHSNSK